MSTTAVGAGACYHRSEATIEVKRTFMEYAERSVLLVDHAKFGRRAPYLLAPLDAFDQIVTDSGADDEEIAPLREGRAQVRVAPVGRG